MPLDNGRRTKLTSKSVGPENTVREQASTTKRNGAEKGEKAALWKAAQNGFDPQEDKYYAAAPQPTSLSQARPSPILNKLLKEVIL